MSQIIMGFFAFLVISMILMGTAAQCDREIAKDKREQQIKCYERTKREECWK